MDKLKNFIDRNRGAFETESLPEGHMERFIGRLRREEQPHVHRRWLGWATIPVAATIAFLLYWQLPFLKDMLGGKPQYVCELHSEMAELRYYYQMQMDGILMQMEEKSAQSDSPAMKELLQAGQQIQKSCQQFDIKVLPTLPCSDVGVLAINQQYRNSLNGMRLLYDKMK